MRTGPLRLAWSATWRVNAVLVAVLVVTVVPIALFLEVAVGDEFSVPILAFAVLFPLSLVLHEWAHAACAWRWSARRLRRECVATGRWGSTSIRRPGLPARFDIATTLAGPAAGTMAAAPLLVLPMFGGSLHESVALAVPFLVHLLALAPVASDGRALLAAIDGTATCERAVSADDVALPSAPPPLL